MSLNRTKIICTIGPACNTVEKMLELIAAGMNVARLNFSHGTHEEHAIVIDRLKQAREKAGVPLAIMLDTKGPEIRLGKIEGVQFQVKAQDRLKLVKESIIGSKTQVSVVPSIVFDTFHEGMTVLIDNGYVQSKVVEVSSDYCVIEFLNDGIISSNKGVNIPNKAIDLPAVTEQDIADIQFGCLHGVDLIAASFVRSAEHVHAIKKIVADAERPDILIIAKIENFQGVHHFDSIVQIADGIMIARGDLGVELPLSQVPHLQKMMIRKCYLASKLSVTATQMLESMIHNPRPTRAEVSDVANAIYDSTSCVMLSGETAVGQYPIETVKVMHSIVKEAEDHFKYRDFFYHDAQRQYQDVASCVTLATVKTAYSASAKAIFAFTCSGLTVRLLSCHRPQMALIGFTPDPNRYHQLAVNWGVYPVLMPIFSSYSKAFEYARHYGLTKGIVSEGDLVVITAGSPFGISGTTNMMLIENIGTVLIRGYGGSGDRFVGKIIHWNLQSACSLALEDKIVVLTKCDESALPILKKAGGVILQNYMDDYDSETYLLTKAKELNLSVITRAEGASFLLIEEQLVTIDPEKALIYNGDLHEELSQL